MIAGNLEVAIAAIIVGQIGGQHKRYGQYSIGFAYTTCLQILNAFFSQEWNLWY